MQLIETIRVCRGRLESVAWHDERFRRSQYDLFGVREARSLQELVSLPPGLGKGVYKCRILYDREVRRVEFLSYRPRRVRSLRLVEDDEIAYGYKFADRSVFDKLLRNNPFDDVLIVKNGRLTDASYANLAFFDGEKWLTPAEPLLPGTKRAKLIAAGTLHVEDLRPSDLWHFQGCRLINAMLVFGKTPILSPAHIQW
jgi:4-amino-4-deoxychorismate lyase